MRINFSLVSGIHLILPQHVFFAAVHDIACGVQEDWYSSLPERRRGTARYSLLGDLQLMACSGGAGCCLATHQSQIEHATQGGSDHPAEA